MTNHYIENRNRFVELLELNSIAIFYSNHPVHRSADQSYLFQVHKDFYYLTGLAHENMILVMTKQHGVVEDWLFIDEFDPYYEKWIGRRLSKEEASEICGIDIDHILYRDDYDKWEEAILRNAHYTQCYLDLEPVKDAYYNAFALVKQTTIAAKYPHLKVKDSHELVVGLRMIKQPYELEAIMESIADTRYGIELLYQNAHSNQFEYELEAFYDFAVKSRGKIVSFITIAASGAHAVTLHYEENHDLMKDGDLVLMDLGVLTREYASDITRTFPVNGKFTSRQREIYEIVLKANKETIDYIKPGLTLREINDFTTKVLVRECMAIGLINDPSEIGKYYYHSVSHSLGLDTHDPIIPQSPLQPGMVVTCEPGLYIASEGLGIRIEDDILVTKDGSKNLSADIIKEVNEIEAFMSRK